MEVFVSVDVGDEFVLQDTHHNIIGSCKTTSPCEQAGAVDTLALNRPFPHQGKGDLRTKSGGKAQTKLNMWIVASLGEVKVTEFVVLLLMICNGWKTPRQ